jgi:nitrogen regulatory protein PII
MPKHVMVLVINRYEKLSRLLTELNKAGIKGATVINSNGMAQALLNNESDHFLGSLRMVLSTDREDNRTIFIVLDEEQIETAKKVIHNVIGTLEKPGTGILFIVPVTYFEGIM